MFRGSGGGCHTWYLGVDVRPPELGTNMNGFTSSCPGAATMFRLASTLKKAEPCGSIPAVNSLYLPEGPG